MERQMRYGETDESGAQETTQNMTEIREDMAAEVVW